MILNHGVWNILPRVELFRLVVQIKTKGLLAPGNLLSFTENTIFSSTAHPCRLYGIDVWLIVDTFGFCKQTNHHNYNSVF